MLKLCIMLLSFFFIKFLLAYSCFTMLCQFLLYNKVNQLFVCISPLFWVSFPFRSPQGIEESFLCQTIGSYCYLFYTQQCVHAGEGHGNPLQCSCLENPADRGAWQTAVHRVTQSWTQLCMHALEKEMAAHSRILAWRIPGTEEPRGLPSMGGSQSPTLLK